MRIWVRQFKDTHMLSDCLVEDSSTDTRTHKVFRALEKACQEMDLAQPIWLNRSISDFKRSGKVRFSQESFIEEIPFDYLEFQIIEED